MLSIIAMILGLSSFEPVAVVSHHVEWIDEVFEWTDNSNYSLSEAVFYAAVIRMANEGIQRYADSIGYDDLLKYRISFIIADWYSAGVICIK
jgi:hypothetical protein